jgi:hypothetical protein
VHRGKGQQGGSISMMKQRCLHRIVVTEVEWGGTAGSCYCSSLPRKYANHGHHLLQFSTLLFNLKAVVLHCHLLALEIKGSIEFLR